MIFTVCKSTGESSRIESSCYSRLEMCILYLRLFLILWIQKLKLKDRDFHVLPTGSSQTNLAHRGADIDFVIWIFDKDREEWGYRNGGRMHERRSDDYSKEVWVICSNYSTFKSRATRKSIHIHPNSMNKGPNSLNQPSTLMIKLFKLRILFRFTSKGLFLLLYPHSSLLNVFNKVSRFLQWKWTFALSSKIPLFLIISNYSFKNYQFMLQIIEEHFGILAQIFWRRLRNSQIERLHSCAGKSFLELDQIIVDFQIPLHRLVIEEDNKQLDISVYISDRLPYAHSAAYFLQACCE